MRMQELDRARMRVEQDITDIWDDLFDVKTSEHVQDLIERINLMLQKGISPNDASALEEIKGNVQEFLVDVNSLKTTRDSRTKFKRVSDDLRQKYQDSDFDFEVMGILEEIIQSVAAELDEKETKWKETNLTLGDKSRKAVHRWKEQIRFLPQFLSEETRQEIETIDKEAEELIKIGKIDDVVFYFEKLTRNEKIECIDRLKELT